MVIPGVQLSILEQRLPEFELLQIQSLQIEILSVTV